MMVGALLQTFGLLLEIAGATLLASAFMSRVDWRKRFGLLIRAIFRGSTAKGYAAIAPTEVSSEESKAIALDGLQGTALLWAGFIFQLAGLIIQLASA